MASLSQNSKSKCFYIHFRYGGRQFHKSLKTRDEIDATELKGRIEFTLRDLIVGRKSLPDDADLWQFLLSDGQHKQKIKAPSVLTLEKLFTRYEEEMPPGAMEKNSIDTFRLHAKHLLGIIGKKSDVKLISTSTLQHYVNARLKQAFRGKTISPVTIKKEIATFRAVWNWAMPHIPLSVPAPVRGLKFPKESQKPDFMTWDEIEKRVQRNGWTNKQAKHLWDALFLDISQVDELLTFVKENASYPFIFPMFVFVAHTGARRSEMMRSQVDDLDFDSGYVLLREKKKDRSVEITTRRVKMSVLFRNTMKQWITNEHPGGEYTFCLPNSVPRSKTRGKSAESVDRSPLTKNEATHHFKKTLAGSKWAVVRGFHVFRHSFASNLARNRAEQREIDALMGHQTEEMQKRYRHFFPEQLENAVTSLFDH